MAPHRPAGEGPEPRRRVWSPVAELAIVVEGAAAALLVALQGSPGFRVLRTLVAVAVTAAALQTLRQTSRWWTGVVLVVFGLVGSVIGTAVGAGHVLKGTAGASALTGLVVLASGLVLLVGGAATLIGAAHRWWNVLVIPISYAVLELGAILITLGEYGTNPPRLSVGGQTPAAFGLRYETVSLRATDGVALSGRYVASRNGAAAVVL